MPGPIFDDETRRMIRALRFHFGRALAADGGNALRSKRVGHGSEFHDHRDYQQGDDPRHIDWNLYGRMGELFVKRFRSEADLELRILVDDSASMALGSVPKRVLALRLAATLAALFGPFTPDCSMVVVAETLQPFLKTGEGSNSMETLWAALESLRPGTAAARLELAAPELQARRNRLVFLISDFLDDRERLLTLLTRRAMRTDLVLVGILAPDELVFPEDGLVEFVDAESGRTQGLVVDRPLADEYRRLVQQHLEQLELLAMNHGARFVFLPSDAELNTAFSQLMRRGGLAT